MRRRKYKFTEKQLRDLSRQMFVECIQYATRKADGRNHEVRVILSDWDGDGLTCHGTQWLSGCVDGCREYGGKLGLGRQKVILRCIVYAPTKEEEAADDGKGTEP